MADEKKNGQLVPVTAKISEEEKAAIVAQLEYGDSMSEWVRKAIQERLERESPEGSKE